MDEPLATVDELQDRLDWVLDSGEQGVAEGALGDLSDDARFYGTSSWTDDLVAPRQVKSLVLRAAARFMRNPDGYTQSRAGDETLQWGDRGENAGSAFFTTREQQMLARIAGSNTSGVISVPLQAWGPSKPTGPGYVQVDPTNYAKKPRDFPFFAEEYI
jgi:hypothetical protein